MCVELHLADPAGSRHRLPRRDRHRSLLNILHQWYCYFHISGKQDVNYCGICMIHKILYNYIVENFRFWPKTMDYSRVLAELRSFSVVFLLCTGRCYEAEICVIFCSF